MSSAVSLAVFGLMTRIRRNLGSIFIGCKDSIFRMWWTTCGPFYHRDTDLDRVLVKMPANGGAFLRRKSPACGDLGQNAFVVITDRIAEDKDFPHEVRSSGR